VGESTLDRIGDLFTNNKKAVVIVLCALVILPIVIYIIYMELNYGRLVVEAERGVGVERVLLGASDELNRERFFERSINVAKGEYAVDILLDDGSVYIAQVEIRSWLRPTRVRPRALDLEPVQISNRLYEHIIPLNNGVVMGYRLSQMPFIHFPNEFRDLNLGVGQIGGACRASSDAIILLGSAPQFGVPGDFGISIYNIRSDTNRTMRVTDGRLMNVDTFALCSRDRMYIVDRARRMIFEVSMDGIEEIRLRDGELIASAHRDLIVSANSTHVAMLHGRDFVDPFSLAPAYIPDTEWSHIYSDYPIELPPNHSLDGANIIIHSRDGNAEDTIIDLGDRDDIFAISLSPDSRHLAVIKGGFVTVYSVEHGERLYTLPAIVAAQEDLIWHGDERFLLLTDSAVLISDIPNRETFSIMARTSERRIQRLSTVHNGHLYFTVKQRLGVMMAAYRVNIEEI